MQEIRLHGFCTSDGSLCGLYACLGGTHSSRSVAAVLSRRIADDRWEHRYLVFTATGVSSGEACFEVPIEQADLIVTCDGREHLVLSVVHVEEDSRFDGFMVVEPT